ncbi:MAG: DUF4395 family protein [Candidatus Staskawiczbacteria bacterium]|nr:DUF4395 family protein [Candidatus Staskawiczbacteria bacterium]
MAQSCVIYNNASLNFFRAVCGFIPLIAFLIGNIWLVLLTSVLFFLGAFSMKLNFIYQIHSYFSSKVLNQKIEPIQKDSGEIKFVYSFTGVMFMASFLMIYFGKFVGIAWGLDLAVSLLTLLASFANLCVASLMYVSYKKVFNK